MAQRKNTPLANQKPTPGKCNALKKDRKLCKLPAGSGTVHTGSGPCKLHGGNLPTVSMHHSVKQLSEALTVQGGALLEIDPAEALLQEVWRCAGRVSWLQDRIHHLADNEIVVDTMQGKQPAVWVRWEQIERAALVQACRACIAAGLAERQVKIAEEQGRLVAEAFRQLLNDPELNLTPAQRAIAPGAVRRALTAVA